MGSDWVLFEIPFKSDTETHNHAHSGLSILSRWGLEKEKKGITNKKEYWCEEKQGFVNKQKKSK